MIGLGRGSKNAGNDVRAGVDDRGALYTSAALGARWYDYAKRGRVFTGNAAAAGSVLPIFSNTAQVFGIWNPAGSDVDAVLLGVTFCYVSTTGAAGGYCLAYVKGTGSGTGTAAQGVSAFTNGTPENALIGATYNNKVRFTPSAATVTAPTIGRQLGLNQLVTTAADATTVPWKADFSFDGDVILPPGNALFVAGNIATLSIWANSITWAEVDA